MISLELIGWGCDPICQMILRNLAAARIFVNLEFPSQAWQTLLPAVNESVRFVGASSMYAAHAERLALAVTV